MYHVDALNQLRRWDYASPLDGSSGWTEQSIGTGWGGLNVVSGGHGVLYAIGPSGSLRWYQDNAFDGSAGASWNPASGSVIGSGWGAFASVVSGGNGVLYAVDPSGVLHWYRYLGTNGSFSWAAGSGATIGTGWNSLAMIVSGGAGLLYGVTASGGLSRYQHLDPLGGSASWANGGAGKPIGTGWSGFSRIGSMGGGVLFARDAGGGMSWYRDLDLIGGPAPWANGGVAINQGTGWNGGQVIADVSGCVAS
jgi:hypothetical protein